MNRYQGIIFIGKPKSELKVGTISGHRTFLITAHCSTPITNMHGSFLLLGIPANVHLTL
jgi:hypothetical protein